jgi:hypothetical protein
VEGIRSALPRALALSANYPTAQWYMIPGVAGRFDEATAEARRAVDRDPLAVIIAPRSPTRCLLRAPLRRGRPRAAPGSRAEPAFVTPHTDLAAVRAAGLYDETIAMFETALRISATHGRRRGYLRARHVGAHLRGARDAERIEGAAARAFQRTRWRSCTWGLASAGGHRRAGRAFHAARSRFGVGGRTRVSIRGDARFGSVVAAAGRTVRTGARWTRAALER